MSKTRIFVSFLLLTISRFAYSIDFEEELLGVPFEYDKYSSDKYLSYLNNEADVWEELQTNEDSNTAVMLLQELCNNYEITINGKVIDCKNLKLTEKFVNKPEHNLQKREAEAPLEEGSGEVAENEEKTIAVEVPKPIDENQNVAPQEKEQDRSSQESKEKSTNNEKQNEKDPEEIKNPEEKEKLEEEKSDQNPEQPSAVTESEKHGEGESDKVEEIPEIKPEDNEEPKVIQESPSIEQTIPPLLHNGVQLTTNEAIEIQAKVDDIKSEDIAPIIPQGEEVTSDKDISSDKEASKETSEVQQESEKKKGKKLGATLENLAEEMSPSQSGNAIDESLTNAEDGEKTVPNSKIKAASIIETEEPKSGESSESTGQSRKDAKILIALFVAVLAVGTAAFTYNYIRKKRRNEARAENGISKSDPEEGREMKPLMKTPATVEETNETKS